MLCTHDRLETENLRRWKRAGGPQGWVEAHQGRWGHDEWLSLLSALRASPFWPLAPEAVGLAVEAAKVRHGNLCRWRESGGPRLWVKERQGRWSDGDWLALLGRLQQSAFWPLDPNAVGRAIEEARVCHGNGQRWRASGAAQRWVEERQGRWGHADWLALLESLRCSKFWPLDEEEVGQALEEARSRYGNLRRWRQSGQARRWIADRRGQWSHEDWLALPQALQDAGFGPVDRAALGQALDEIKLEWWGVHRWRMSGLARRWVSAHQGRWGHDDWLELLEELRASDFWPMDAEALGLLLEELKVEWLSQRRWQWPSPVRGVWEGLPPPVRRAA
jgi:hypothetical protein